MTILIPILVGAIIGYITNWLAIKMLFRPYTEKKLLGIHIPFTPGLIPKEMNRIAKSVGETIGQYLLSPEIVAESLSSDRAGEQIRTWVEGFIERLKQSHKTLKELIISAVGENYDKMSAIIEQRVSASICFGLREEKFKLFIKGKLDNLLFDQNGGDFYKELKQRAVSLIYRLSAAENTRTEIKKAVDAMLTVLENNDRYINEAVPESIIGVAKGYIIEHDEDIVNILKDMLESPVIKRRVKALISELISQNTSRVLTLFMSSEAISEKVYDAIEKYISDPANSKSIILIVTTSLDKLLQGRVSNVFSGVSPELREQGINQITDIVIGCISDRERQDRVINLVEEKVKASEAGIKENIGDFISNKLDDFLESPELMVRTECIVHDVLDGIVNKQVSSILKDVDASVTSAIVDLSEDIFNSFVTERLPYFVQLLNIPKIVEDKINGFDVVFAEEIIIDIANKELKAITWLGALLGGIMGILTPLIGLLYK